MTSPPNYNSSPCCLRQNYRFPSFAFLALALACITSPPQAVALVSYDVGDVGPDNQGRIPRFGAGGCVDSEPRFEYLTRKVPRRIQLTADPEEEVAAARRNGLEEVAPIKDSPTGPVVVIVDRTCPYAGVTCVDMPPSPSDPKQRYVPLDHDGFGHAVGYMKTVLKVDEDHGTGTGGGPIGEVAEQVEVEIALPDGDGPTSESIGSMTIEELVNDVVTGPVDIQELEALPVKEDPLLPDIPEGLPDLWQAAYFHNGEVELLATPPGYDSVAYAIDKPDSLSSDKPRWIVGMISDPQGVYTAVVWINGTRHALSEVMTVHSSWDLWIATDLDARGYVLGVGNHTSLSPTERVFVGRLIPQPLELEVSKTEIGAGGVHVGQPWGPPNPSYCARWPHQRDSGRRAGQTHCDNGGFEDGNFDEWKGRYTKKPDWIKNGMKRSWFKNGMVTGGAPDARHTIMDLNDGNNGYDINLGGTLLPVVAPGSSYSAMLGNMEGNDHSEMLKRKVKITEDTKQFRFNFAVVMRDAGHDAAIQPSFQIRVIEGKDSNGFPGIFHDEIYNKEFWADGSDPLFLSKPGTDLIYTPWRCHVIDLSEYVDKWVTIVFQTRDCGKYTHWGYTYIDHVCGNSELVSTENAVLDVETNVCPSLSGIWADGSASTGAISAHFWSVQESTAGWVGIGPEVNDWFPGHPGSFDVLAYANGKGLEMRCGRHYRVKLAVSNECSTWTDTTKLIYLDCPVIDAGPDQWICLGDSVDIGLGALAPALDFVGWTTSTGTAVSTNIATTVSPTTSTTYIATVVENPSGCQGWDDISIGVVSQPVTQAVILHKGTCDCTNRRVLTAYAWGKESEPGTSFLWSTGETTPSITVDNPDTINYQVTYSVTVSNACGSASAVTVVEEIGSPLSFFAPNTYFPNSGGDFVVWHAGTSAGIRPSYGKYTTFRVWDRWGGILYQQTAYCAENRPNGWLKWDGTYRKKNIWGNWVTRLVPDGVYDYTLEYDDKCQGASGITTEAYHVTVLT